MNKTDLVEKIAAGAGISKADAKKALDAAIAAVKDALVCGDKVSLVGFGTFAVSERPAREGINPATLSKIGVVIDEVMNNIISYGKTKTNKTLMMTVEKVGEGANLTFIDNSHPFNPLTKQKHTIPENMEKGIVGGVGISIVTSISKECEYTYSNNKNILIIKF